MLLVLKDDRAGSLGRWRRGSAQCRAFDARQETCCLGWLSRTTVRETCRIFGLIPKHTEDRIWY